MKRTQYCYACQSNQIKTIETLPITTIASGWSNIDLEASTAIIQYANQGKLPAIVHIDRCRVCGLEFANPSFEAEAEWYAKIEKYGVRWEFIQCLKDLGHQPRTLLEVGCGEGYFLELATHNGHSILGIDFNEVAIKVAQAKGMDAYPWNLKELRVHLDIKFDAVMFFHVIEHLEDPEAFFSDLAEIMPTGSTLHFSCPGPRRFTTDLEPGNKVGLRDMWDYPPCHQSRWNRKAAEKLLSRTGWKLKTYMEEPFNWLGVSTFLVSKDLILKGLDPSEQSSLTWKIKILKKLIQIFIPVLLKKYKGMSMYCMGVRQ